MPNTSEDPSAERAIVPAKASAQALEVRRDAPLEGVVLERPIALKLAT
jgi:hypothetical protein